MAATEDTKEILAKTIELLTKEQLKIKPETGKLKKKADDDDFEDDFDDDEEEEDKDVIIFSYSPAEEQALAENFYQSKIDHAQLFSYSFLSNRIPADIYEDEIPVMSDTRAESMNDQEAKEMLITVQYAKVLGTMTEIDSGERQKFATWVKFNPALWRLFHRNYAVTEEVDYSKTF